MKHIYAILDTVTDDIIGGLQLHAHPASAVRTFGDIASDPKTTIAKHPHDFALIALGKLTDEHTLEPYQQPEIIITAAAWLAAQPAPDTTQLSLLKDA